MKKYLLRISLISSMVISYIIATILLVMYQLAESLRPYGYGLNRISLPEFTLTSIVWSFFVSLIFVYPIVLTGYHILLLYLEANKKLLKPFIRFDQVAIWYGLILEFLYLTEGKYVTGSDWSVQLKNLEMHTPIFSEAAPTIIFIFVIGIAGYLYLRVRPLKKIPPLMAIISMSAMYLWVIEVLVFTVQVFKGDLSGDNLLDVYLLVYPVCIICIVARTVISKVHEWQEYEMERAKIQSNPLLNFADKILSNSKLWPIYAIIFMFPLLGIIIGILLLFGQAPDSVIKAWTETADWTLSLKEAPQNIEYDEHYLCTVAAGGHKKIVKPIRKGIRHGHEVIVNRQLCIANAFEQILEEKTPRFHKLVRGIYDRYGFPIARLIKSKWIADIIYILMKPLEWIFLMVIYMSDVHPENRIATQYMGKNDLY
jgi:putative membrane protein